MVFVALLIALSIVFFWAGFKAPPHPLQQYSRVGFFIALGLLLFAG